MRHVDNRDTFRLELVQEREQLLDILRRKSGARFIEDKNFGVARNRLDDLGELALAGAEIAGQRLRIDIDIEAGEQLARPGGGGAVVDQAQAVLVFVGQENVLRHRQCRHQAHLLEDHGNAGFGRRFGREFAESFAEHFDGSRIGLVNPAQHFQDRRFAGAIAAQKGVNLTGLHFEMDIA